MKGDALSHILKTLPGFTPSCLPEEKDWVECERELGREIPQDYKSLVAATGNLSIGRCWLRNPSDKSAVNASLSRAALGREYAIFGGMMKEMLNIDMYPEIGGWIQLANVDREFFMIKPSGDAIMIVSLSSWVVWDTAMGFTELMWELFNRRSLYGNLGGQIWHRGSSFFGF